MYKKVLSYLLIATMTVSSLQMGTLTVSASGTIAEETLDKNEDSQDGNGLNEATGDLNIDVPEAENPETEIPEDKVPDAENEEASKNEEKDEENLEGEEVLPEESVKEDKIPEEVPEEVTVEEEKEDLDELAEKYREELPDGTYYIRTALSNQKVLGIQGKSVSNKARVIVGTFEKSDSQRWRVRHDEKGYITFVNEKSDKVLDVSNGGRDSSKTVWQYTSNNTSAQKWIARKDGNNYEIISAINGMVLDVKGGSSSENTGLQIYSPNGTTAQRFQMISVNPEIAPGEEMIPEGMYRLIPQSKPEYAVDIKNASYANKANVQLGLTNDGLSQIFNVKYSDGYYTFTNKYSCKALDVEMGGFMPGTNVWQYTYNSSKAQKWAARQNEDGTYSFISVHNGMALGIDGTNVQVENPGETENQKFVLEKADNSVLDRLAQENKDAIQDGIYYMRSTLKNTSVVQIKNESTANRGVAVIHQFEKDSSQQWEITHDDKGYVTFTNVKSGKVLDVANGGRNTEKTVWQYTANESKAQKWIVKKEGSYYRIISALNGMSMDVIDEKSADNTGLQIYASKNIAAQKFQIIAKDPKIEKCKEVIPSGYYYIGAKENSSYVFDIQNGSDANKANVQLYKGNNTFAQAFDIRYKDGYYTIRNMYSNKMLDVASGGYMPATNVWQYTENGTVAQKWSVKDNGEGSYTFISVHNGMVLDIEGGKIASGTNIRVYTPNGSDTQKFVLKKAESFYEGSYNIKSAMSSSFVMEIAGGNTGNKTNIQLYKNNKTESQKWLAIKNEDGTFYFKNSKSGKVLDIANGNIKQGNYVWAYSYNGTDAQKWDVEKLEDHTWRIVSAKNKDYVLAIENDSAISKAKIVIQKWDDSQGQKWTFGKVDISNHVVSVEIEEGKEYVLDKGKTHTLKGKEIFLNGIGNELSWKSSNDSVTVSNTGKITAVKHGNAIITATSRSDRRVKAEIRVYVRETKGQLTKGKLDSMNLSRVKKLMIVAHPDDETFWGGGHLLEDDWLVVCFTNGRNKTRSREFANAMKYSNDKAIILDYADTNDNQIRDNWKYAENGMKKDIELLVGYKNWSQIVVHNPEGEYGHKHHVMANDFTIEVCKEKGLFNKLYYFGKFYKTVPNDLKPNLSEKTLAKKREMIKKYPSQLGAYTEKWKQMESHEHWVKATRW